MDDSKTFQESECITVADIAERWRGRWVPGAETARDAIGRLVEAGRLGVCRRIFDVDAGFKTVLVKDESGRHGALGDSALIPLADVEAVEADGTLQGVCAADSIAERDRRIGELEALLRVEREKSDSLAAQLAEASHTASEGGRALRPLWQWILRKEEEGWTEGEIFDSLRERFCSDIVAGALLYGGKPRKDGGWSRDSVYAWMDKHGLKALEPGGKST